MSKIRLDKFLSTQTTFGRSELKKMIFKGLCSVDGQIITAPDTKIDSDKCRVILDGKEIVFKKYVYICMNKPKGILSATEDKKAKTVVDILPEEYKKRNIFPAGRLDKESTGLVLLTDDGDFAHYILSPKHHIEKSYIVTLDKEVTDDVVRAFESGVTLADGTQCLSAKCIILGKNKVRIILTEGKYHQIKRMFGVYDIGVNELHRERMGKLILPMEVEEGQFFEVKPDDLIEYTSNR